MLPHNTLFNYYFLTIDSSIKPIQALPSRGSNTHNQYTSLLIIKSDSFLININSYSNTHPYCLITN